MLWWLFSFSCGAVVAVAVVAVFVFVFVFIYLGSLGRQGSKRHLWAEWAGLGSKGSLAEKTKSNRKSKSKTCPPGPSVFRTPGPSILMTLSYEIKISTATNLAMEILFMQIFLKYIKIIFYFFAM